MNIKYINDTESVIITIIRMASKNGTLSVLKSRPACCTNNIANDSKDNEVKSTDNSINTWVTVKCLIPIQVLTKDHSLFIQEIEDLLGYKTTSLSSTDEICFQFNINFTIYQNNRSNNKQNIKPIGKCLDRFIKNFNDKHKEKI